MKGKIEIEFIEISGVSVKNDIIKNNLQLKEITKKTLINTCKDLEDFFKSKKIKTKVSLKELEF